jgi:hypothetical protein
MISSLGCVPVVEALAVGVLLEAPVGYVHHVVLRVQVAWNEYFRESPSARIMPEGVSEEPFL